MNNYLKGLQLLIISFLTSNVVYSQNLIINSSFENITNCPTMDGQLEYAIGWFDPDLTIAGTPDLFHTCSTVLSIPNCCNGAYQWPKTGNAYAGIYTYNKNFNNVREYLATKILDSLKINTCYFFSMYINSMNSSSYGTNGLGVYFSENKIESTSNDLVLHYEPQIFSSNIIYDSVNWLQISGYFKPNIVINYLTIGNFFDDTATDTLKAFSDIQRSAIYLIDDVSLFQLGQGYAGKDSTILLGESIFIGQEVENLPSKWSVLGGAEIANNLSGVLVSPIVTTTYVCEQNFCGELMYDTITVTVVDDAGISDFGYAQSPNNSFKINPNPNNGSFELLNPLADEVHFELYNTVGQLVYSQNTKDKTSKIELSLERGVYFATFNKQLYSQKIVIQ